jgi:hypothetical protein
MAYVPVSIRGRNGQISGPRTADDREETRGGLYGDNGAEIMGAEKACGYNAQKERMRLRGKRQCGRRHY